MSRCWKPAAFSAAALRPGASYQQAFNDVFSPLDELETLLSASRTFLLGERLTETDIRLFVTLIGFDVAYHGLFRLLNRYLKSMLSVSGIRE